MPRPSPLLSCRRAFPCSPPCTAMRNARPRYVRRAPPVGSAWVSDLNRLRSFRRSLSGPFEGLTSLRLGQPPLGRRRERWRNFHLCPALRRRFPSLIPWRTAADADRQPMRGAVWKSPAGWESPNLSSASGRRDGQRLGSAVPLIHGSQPTGERPHHGNGKAWGPRD